MQYYFLTCLTLIFLGHSVTREEPLHERIIKAVNQICISVSALRKAYKNDNEEDKGGKNSCCFFGFLSNLQLSIFIFLVFLSRSSPFERNRARPSAHHSSDDVTGTVAGTNTFLAHGTGR